MRQLNVMELSAVGGGEVSYIGGGCYGEYWGDGGGGGYGSDTWGGEGFDRSQRGIDTTASVPRANYGCSDQVSQAQYSSLANGWNTVAGVGGLLMATGAATPVGFAVGTSAALMSLYNTYCATPL